MNSGIARGSNPNQPMIFGRKNINYVGPSKASESSHTSINPYDDFPDTPQGHTLLNPFRSEELYDMDADTAADTIQESLEQSEGTVWVNTPTGRTLPVIGAETQTTTRKGSSTEHILLEVDTNAVMPDGRTFAEHISGDMKLRYDADAVGKQVTVVTPQELRDDYTKYFLSADGLSGIGVKHTGEIGGLYALEDIPDDQGNKHTAPRGTGLALLQQSMDEGGTYLECFDTFLTGYYKKAGMVPVAELEFNRDYAPEGWDYDAMHQYHDGEPPIMFMVRSDLHNPEKVEVFQEWDDADSYTHTLVGDTRSTMVA